MNISYDTLKRIHEALEFIESGKLDNLDIGHHDLTTDMYVNVMSYDTKDTGIFESHHKYIDIHYVIEGSEIIELIEESKLDVTEKYNEENDYILGNAKGSKYLIRQKQTFVVMPGEAHLPGLKNEKYCKIKKAVLKVKF